MFKLNEMRGDTIKLQITVTRGGEALNLTGATFKFTARKWKSGSALIEKDNTAFAVASPASGVAILTIDPADTESITEDVKLYCDVEMTESDGVVTTVAEGTIDLKYDISR